MRKFLSVVCLCLFGVGVFAGNRTEYVIKSATWYDIPVGPSTLRLAVKPEFTKIQVSFGGNARVVEKVSGFSSNDTNRTLIYVGYKAKLYFVDATDTAAGMVKLVVIED